MFPPSTVTHKLRAVLPICWYAIALSSSRSVTWALNDAGVACVMRLVATVPVTNPWRLAASRTVPNGWPAGFTAKDRKRTSNGQVTGAYRQGYEGKRLAAGVGLGRLGIAWAMVA